MYASVEREDFYDLIIIGGGPHALALAGRLFEKHPSALYTDIEHVRLSFLHKRFPNRTTTEKPWALISPVKVREPPRLLALDSTSSSWLGRWKGYFNHLAIRHLRSPMFFHPGPADVDGLEAFVQRNGYEKDCAPCSDSILREDRGRKSKTSRRGSRHALGNPLNERERSNYARPTSHSFEEYCHQEIVLRYSLETCIQKEAVVALQYFPNKGLHVKGDGLVPAFSIQTASGRRLGAKAVVVAVGGQEIPRVPSFLTSRRGDAQGEGWCHSSCFSLSTPKSFEVACKKQGSTIAIVGGGLTAAQLVDLALRRGASKALMICRSGVKIKHYDFPLGWVSKYGNLQTMAFYQEDCREARLEMIREARNGGSVNPQTHQILKAHVASGRLDIHAPSQVIDWKYDTERSAWTLCLSSKGVLPLHADYVVAATGGELDFGGLPFLRPLLDRVETKVVGGLPALTEDLQIAPEVPCFVMGAYAGLELGPAAANLAGARTGAERVASRLAELRLWDDEDVGDGEGAEAGYFRRAENSGGWFDGLGEVSA